jgi:hypothetical protein
MEATNKTVMNSGSFGAQDTVYMDPDEARRTLEELLRRDRSDSGPVFAPPAVQ